MTVRTQETWLQQKKVVVDSCERILRRLRNGVRGWKLENTIEIRELGFSEGMPQRLEFVSRYCTV